MTTFRFGDFEWDEAKARANLKEAWRLVQRGRVLLPRP